MSVVKTGDPNPPNHLVYATDNEGMCRFGKSLNTDWCQADAMRNSLREHMALLKAAYDKIEKLESQRIDEIVVGDMRITEDDSLEGTVLSSFRQCERVVEAGLKGKWCQIIIRPA